MMLELDGVSHRYETDLAVEDVSLGVDRGEIVGILGPSGCGKTTLVQTIAGHVRPAAGRVVLRGEDVTDTPPEARHVGVVFQEPTLFPHMTVGENVAYGLAARAVGGSQREDRIVSVLDLVSLRDHRTDYPAALSGGQRRRAELARALAPEPDLLVLDEPLSALDRALRHRLRTAVRRIQRETGVTMLFVTHDQDDAMSLADRLVVMNDGRIAATGEPRDLYQSPPNQFVASFLGRSNTFAGTLVGTDPPTVEVGEQELTLEDTTTADEGTAVTCHARPTDSTVVPASADPTGPVLAGEVAAVRDVGRRYDVSVLLPTGAELLVEQTSEPPTPGEAVRVELSRLSLFE